MGRFDGGKRVSRRRALALGAGALVGVSGAGALASDAPLRLRDLYEKDLSFTPLARERAGSRVAFRGFMAPPLKAESLFFVLTKRPMAVCPFCETEAEWPDDILAVYCKRPYDVVSFNSPILARGVLELGGHTDPETGFVSRVRLTDAVVERL